MKGKKVDLKAVLDLVEEGVAIIDTEYVILHANRAFSQILGVTQDWLEGKKCYKVFHKTDEPVGYCPISKCLRTKKPHMQEAFETHLDRLLSFSAVPLLDEAGAVEVVAYFVKDITDKKLMEKDFEARETVDRMKEELISNVSHELRTPLTVAKGAIEIILEEEDSERKRNILKMGHANLNRLNNLIEDLLTAAKLKPKPRGKHEVIVNVGREQVSSPSLVSIKVITREPVDISELIKSSIGEFAKEARKKNVTVKSQIAEDFPKILGDALEMRIVITHLIGNAIKFNKKGGAVTVEGQAKEDSIVISVRDEGIGILKEQFERIFGRFYQVDGSTTRAYSGTGLGLFLVKSIVEKHGGKIWVESKVGEGSSFIFKMPIKDWKAGTSQGQDK
ncbi:MAG: PAS domain-containing sensor histidine kinase [Candidatus Hydrothermarchaeaceae archaeon]